MMNMIKLDKGDPNIAKALEGCEIGKPVTLTVTVTPTVDDDKQFVADVDEVKYKEREEEEEAPAEGEMPPALAAISGNAKETY